VRTPAGLREEQLIAGLQAVLDRHGMLRARLDGTDLVVPPAGAVAAAGICRRMEIAGLAELGREAEEATGRLDPRAGVMVQAVWFDAGDNAGDAAGRLLLVIHHLAVDGVSWRILLPDLAAATAGAVLPAAGTSFRRWAMLLADRAASSQALA